MAAGPSRRRVVVTGYGMITTSGRNTQETFEKCSKGLSGIDYIRSFDTAGLPCRIAGEVDDTWIEEFENNSDQRLRKFSSRGLRLMRIAASEASAQAGLDRVGNRDNIGVSLGSHGDNPRVEDIKLVHRFYDGAGNWDMEGLLKAGGYPFLHFFRRKPDAAASLLSTAFDCRGPVLSLVSACAAGSQAIGEAVRLIEDKKCDVMIAGGCEATIDFTGMIGFILLKALCEKYSEPQKASRPFDRKRGGFVMSEGAGALVLEELEHARARGAQVLGEIKGYGSSADAYRITDTHPKGLGAVIAMKAALSDAGITPEDIDYVN
ncbi:MAG: beta-ketoacyl-[acyl-carrier-protein] synthase family protein, partial [Nitrospirota bacterium]